MRRIGDGKASIKRKMSGERITSTERSEVASPRRSRLRLRLLFVNVSFGV